MIRVRNEVHLANLLNGERYNDILPNIFYILAKFCSISYASGLLKWKIYDFTWLNTLQTDLVGVQ